SRPRYGSPAWVGGGRKLQGALRRFGSGGGAVRLGGVVNVNRKVRALGALAGVAAAAVAIGLAELIAALTGPQSAPIIAVGDVVIDATPLPVKEFATKTFGTGDKTALITGTFVILALIAAAVGGWAVRDIRLG